MKSAIQHTCQTLLAILLLAFWGCEKEAPPQTEVPEPIIDDVTAVLDTVYPSSYFPAFPGSYWVYDNGDTMRVAAQYQICIYEPFFEAPKDTLVLPKLYPNGIYNGTDSIAWVRWHALSPPRVLSYGEDFFVDLLTDSLGYSFGIDRSWQGHQTMRMAIAVDTTVMVESRLIPNIVVMITYDQACVNNYGPPQICSYKREFYARDIGLVRRDTKQAGLDSTYLTVLELVDYHINN